MKERQETQSPRPSISETNSPTETNRVIEMTEGVFLVRGARRGAICDTNTGKVYSINESAVKVILGQQEDPEYWHQLQELQLVSTKKEIKAAEIKKQEPKLDFVWFEIISDDCNESCRHCYAESMPPAHRKALGIDIPVSELKDYQKKPKLTEDDWKRMIKEAYELGARQCQFIGGEPFLYVGDKRSQVLDFAAYAKELGYEFIEIFTNGTLVTKADIAKIKELGIHIAVSLYSSDPGVHNTITQTPTSHDKTVRTLKRLNEASVPTRAESVLMRDNQHTVEATKVFIQELGFELHSPDVLRPKGRGDNTEIQPDDEYLVRYGLMLGPNFSAQRAYFERYYSSHSCLAGKITITDKGDVLPCIFSRDQIMGNVQEAGSLKAVVEGEKLDDVWKTTKDDVLVCQDCEYRYVCFDCRPISQGANNGNGEYKTVPYPRCTYNPYKGEWGGGVWRVNKDGRPYYDESLKPIIEKIKTSGASGSQAKGH